MPLDTQRLIGEIRLDCNQPDLHAPGDDLILQTIADKAQMMFNEIQNQQPSWSMEQKNIGPDLFVEPFRLNLVSFGKPVRLHTVDPYNPQYPSEPIAIVRPQELALPGQGASERQASFHYAPSGLPMLTVIPPFGQPTMLRLWYELGELPELTLGDNPIPVMPQFHRYLRTLCVIAVLGYCEWSRLCEGLQLDPFKKRALFDQERNRLLPSRIADEARERQSWNTFIATGFQDGDGGCREYAGWVEDAY